MKKMNLAKILYILLTISLLALSACTARQGSDPLDSTSWQLVSISDKLLLPGTTLTLTFAQGRAGGNGGCNTWSGSYKLDGDKFTLDELATTLMACLESGVMDQEQVYLNFLQEVNSYSLSDGMLYLYRADGSALKFVPSS